MKLLLFLTGAVMLAACNKEKSAEGPVHCRFNIGSISRTLTFPDFSPGTYTSGGMKAIYYQAKSGPEKFQVNINSPVSGATEYLLPASGGTVTVSYTMDSSKTYILRKGSISFGTVNADANTYEADFSGIFKNQFNQNDSVTINGGYFYFRFP